MRISQLLGVFHALNDSPGECCTCSPYSIEVHNFVYIEDDCLSTNMGSDLFWFYYISTVKIIYFFYLFLLVGG